LQWSGWIGVDEPTAGLDPEERIRFRTLLSHLAGDRTVLLSTHIVEDIAQTCQQLAVLAKGRVAIHGAVTALTEQARGLTWSITTTGPAPTPGTIVSALPHGSGMRYRVVTAGPPADAEAVEPTLEDGYLALSQATSGAT
jgi:ABC-2 type transport system ATP-binding protein